MNSLPTPQSSPVGQSGAIKSKDAKDAKIASKKEKKAKKKLSKSFPGTAVNQKRKSLFPKVVLPIFSKSTKKESIGGENNVPARRKSVTKRKSLSKKDPDFLPDFSVESTSEDESLTEKEIAELKKSLELNIPKVKTPKNLKTPKSPKTPESLKSPTKNAKTPIKKTPKTPKTAKKKKKSLPEKETEIVEDIKEEEITPAKKIKLNGESTEELKLEKKEISRENIDWKFGVKWVPGKLAWARIGNYPLWPCVITIDPESMTFHRTKVTTWKTNINLIHVQYFGDNERHSWVTELNIFPFTGANDLDRFLEKFMNENSSKARKREMKIACTVNSSIKAKWENAISEMTEIFGISDEDRACIFAPAPQIAKSNNLQPKKKRKHSLDESLPVVPVKKSKSNASPNKLPSPKIQNEPKSRKATKSSKTADPVDKTNLDPSKKNSKLNKSTGDLSKICGKPGKLNGAFSKSTGNLMKLFENLTPKPNGKLDKSLEKALKVNGKFFRSLKSSKVDIYDSLSQTPPTPPSSLLNSSWDDEKKNSSFDIDYDSKLLALCDPELEEEIKQERWSDPIQTNGEEFNKSNILDVTSEFEVSSKSRTRRSRSRRESKIDGKEKKEKKNEGGKKEEKDKKEKEKKDEEKKDEKEKKEKEKKEKKEKKESKDKKNDSKIEKDLAEKRNDVKDEIKSRKSEKDGKDKKEEKEVKDKKNERDGKEEKEVRRERRSVREIKDKKDEKDTKEFEATDDKDFLKIMKPMNLFRGIKLERVCQICEQTGQLVRCKGPCFSYYHLKCVKPEDSSPEISEVEDNVEDEVFQDLKEIRKKIAEKESESFSEKMEVKAEEPEVKPEEETFKCIDCLSSVAPACFICNDREIDRVRCTYTACGKYYHPSCLRIWPQAIWQGGRLICPYHMCHTCNSDDPQNGHNGKTNEKLVRCVRCPSSYHTSSSCLPAGSEILTGHQIICPKHYKSKQAPLNATWCFLCTKGGSLICCETCPTSFHPECLDIKAPDGAFICEDCETGRLPLYGEVVWVKLGSYRWWPSKICFPDEVPVNVEAMNHNIGEFCVMFLGTRNYYWVHKGRAFLYQEGDAISKPNSKTKGMEASFRKALQEAYEYYQILKKQKAATKDQEKQLRPPTYVKLKVNKPVGNVKTVEVDSIVACVCSPSSDSACAQDADCINRMLFIECSLDICPAGSKCQNQRFEQRNYPAMEPFHTDGRGWGLRALEPIKSNQFVIEYVGEIIDEAEYRRRIERKKEQKNENFYFLTIDTNRMIDAEPKGNLSRFMNHSCQPNCETQKWTVNGDTRIGLFALRDIEIGEELTFNYNLSCDGEKKKPCLCGAPNCSGFIGLKVQKQNNSAIREKKVEIVDKPKKPKKPKKVISICENCQKEIARDELIKCKKKSCSKKYHKSCITMSNLETEFLCPTHLCFECGRTTSTHCFVCKIAFCQVHLPKNMVESKGSFVCKNHQIGLSLMNSSRDEAKEKLDNLETRNLIPLKSSSPIPVNKPLLRNQDQSSRVSIEEVEQLSCEENTEDTDAEDSEKIVKDANTARRRSRRISQKLDALKSLNSEQLLAIIGGEI